MKQFFGAAALAVGAFAVSCFGATQVAEAGTIKIDINGSNYSGGNGGGEFAVVTFTGGPLLQTQGAGVAVGIFQTFCMERNENVNTSSTYNYSIDTAAVYGGFAGQDTTVGGNSADSLDRKTAYLYQKFWDGNLTGYTFSQGSARTASATALQLAIWAIENELVPTGGSNAANLTNAFNNNSLAQTFYNDAVDHAGSGIGQVRILNLELNGQRQSMLVVVSAVPLPPAAWLGLGMMSAMGAFEFLRRRRRQALV